MTTSDLEYPAYPRLPQPAVSASGCELVLADGSRVLDLYGGHCVNTLGAGDPGVGRAVGAQWERLSFVTNLLECPARDAFFEAFGANLPPGAWQVFLSNSGAEANENALKAALSATGRTTVVAFAGAFHGRTAAAAALGDAKHPAFPRTPFDVRRAPFGEPDAARALVDEDVAAVVLEPIQSLAGVRAFPAEELAALRARCDEVGAALVFDEVQTGNGRLAAPWASQALGVVPDAFTTAKGAASGLPIGITVLSEALAARVGPGLFGSTFGGGPTVLAAATEVARRIAAPAFAEQVAATSAALRAAARRGPVRAVRGAGLLLGLELDGLPAAEVRDALLARGVLVGTSNDPHVLRLTPPLTLTPEQAEPLGAALASLEVTA